MKRLVSFLIGLVVLTILVLTIIDFPKTGVAMSSDNIKHSKDLDVFIKEFIPSNRLIKSKESTFEIVESWVELSWSYQNMWKKIEVYEEELFYVRIRNNDRKVYDLKFDLDRKVISSGHGHDRIIVQFDNNQTPDHFEIKFDSIQSITFSLK